MLQKVKILYLDLQHVLAKNIKVFIQGIGFGSVFIAGYIQQKMSVPNEQRT